MNSNEVIRNLQIKNGKLQVQIERLKLDKEEYYLDYLDLQQRISKAIEYIGLNDEDVKLYDIYDVNGIELLKILRGEDNE